MEIVKQQLTNESTNEFYLEQARNICGVIAYNNFKTYINTPFENRSKLDSNIIYDYYTVTNVIDRMKSYGNNHWWVIFDPSDVNLSTQDVSKDELANLRKKARVYYQVFDCGLKVLLVPLGQLTNDLNDLFQHTNIKITSWMLLKYPNFFEFYKSYLKQMLDSDKEFQTYLRKINSE